MLTVKEFKDFGVKFVAGDVRSSSARGHGDVEMTGKLADGTNLENDVDHESIKSFAWRPLNTLPDNSKFRIEFKNSDSEFEMEMWRPLLDQSALKPVNGAAVKPSDDKPVFTQEMADRCELPPVGSKAMQGSRLVECVAVHNGGVVVFLNDEYYPVYQHELSPIDTRTPKQKAVDAALLAFNIDKKTLDSIYSLWNNETGKEA
jgi:hypothetical protein